MSRNVGGPAFPSIVLDTHNQLLVTEGGMTLRAYFAAKAMQAMIAKSSGQDTTGGKDGVPLIAKYACEYADALIAELAK